MLRRVDAELLDRLPASNPRAIRARRDLQRVNLLMGHPQALALALRGMVSGSRLVELGAGDGTFLLSVARRLHTQPSPVQAVLVDLRPSLSAATREGFEAAGWRIEVRESDVFEWLERPDADVWDITIANLFLHHFREKQLSELLARAAGQTRRFIACEPFRSPASLIGASLLPLVGCGSVTLHDARASVRAGFRGRELSTLWPRSPHWHLTERRGGPFTHMFLAESRLTPDA